MDLKNKRIIMSAVFTAAAVAAAVFTCFFPQFIVVTFIFSSVLFSLSGFGSDIKSVPAIISVSALALGAVAAVLTGGTQSLFIYLLCLLPIGATLSFCFAKKSSVPAAVLGSIIVTGVFLVVSGAIYIALTTTDFSFTDAFSPVTDALRRGTDSIYDFIVSASAAGGIYAQYEAVLTAFIELGKDGFYDLLLSYTLTTVPVLAGGIITVISVATYYIQKAVCCKLGENITHMTAADSIYMRREPAVMFFALYAINFIFSLFVQTSSPVNYAIAIITGIINIYAYICAISIGVYMLKHHTRVRMFPRILITIGVIAVTATVPVISSLVPLVGLLDPFVNFRMRFRGTVL